MTLLLILAFLKDKTANSDKNCPIHVKYMQQTYTWTILFEYGFQAALLDRKMIYVSLVGNLFISLSTVQCLCY